MSNGCNQECRETAPAEMSGLRRRLRGGHQGARQYGYHHKEKGATDKAATNFGYAAECGNALEHLRLAVESISKEDAW
jgi:hypothetical protein